MSLAEDLVTVAAQAIRDAYDEDCNALAAGQAVADGWWTSEAQAAVVAVLKRLAAKPDGYLRHQEDGGITYTRTLRELAAEIESAALGVPQAEKPQP